MDRHGRRSGARFGALILSCAFLISGPAFAEAPTPFLPRSVPQPSSLFRKALLETPAPELAKVLAIAEKYYSKARKEAKPGEQALLKRLILRQPDFTGRTVDRARASLLSNPTAVLVGYTDLKGLYLALGAVVFALDVGNPTYAGNLASAIVTWHEDKSGKPIAEDIGAARPHVVSAAALYEHALSIRLAQLYVDIDTLPLLLNYGHLCIDADRLDKAKALFSAALAIAPDYPTAREGMAAYWIAKGDRAAAEKALGEVRLPGVYRKTAEMNRETTEKKAPEVETDDDYSVIERKLETLRETPIVLAPDYYEDLAPDAVAEVRRFFESQAADLRYKAPVFNYLSQYSTLRVFLGRQGQSAMAAFEAEFTAFSKKHGKLLASRGTDALSQLGIGIDIGGMSLEDAVANPKTFKEKKRGKKARIQGLEELKEKAMEMKRGLNQADADSRRGNPGALQSMAAAIRPELAIFKMNPSEFANPTDLLVQRYNMWILQKKLRGYKLSMAKENEKIRTEIEEKGKRIASEMFRLKTELAEALERAKTADTPTLHQIHMPYNTKMNNVSETGWMDLTNLVNVRYLQRTRPGIERMYSDVMRHVMLISDPKIRGRLDREVSTEVYMAVIEALGNVARAYGVYDRDYPFECGCDPEEIEKLRERKRQEFEDSDADATRVKNMARAEFEQGAIKDTTQLYKNLDVYTHEFDLLFMHAKWHPLRTELLYSVKLPKIGEKEATLSQKGQEGKDLGAIEFRMIRDEGQVRNMTTYGGGVNWTLAEASAAGGAAAASVGVGLGGEVTVDGDMNIVRYDAVARAEAQATAGIIQSTAAVEASVMRGSKASLEVAQVCNTKAFAPVANDLRERLEEPMGIAGGKESKKVLWSGEYQFMK